MYVQYDTENNAIAYQRVRQLFHLNGYDVAFTRDEDTHVWSSAGAPAGYYQQVIVADGPIQSLVQAGNKVYFTAEVDDPTDLIVVDAQGARYITPAVEEANPTLRGANGPFAIFEARNSEFKYVIYATDGLVTQQIASTYAEYQSEISIVHLDGDKHIAVLGTEGADVINLDDGLYTYPWVDMYLGAGDDRLTSYSNPSNLNVDFGGGNDYARLYGVGGVLHGGEGNDSLVSYGGGELYGDSGDDFLGSIEAPSHLYGGEGNDYLTDGANDSQLFGGNGDDGVYGGIFAYGGDGNDEVQGGWYEAYGGNGDDNVQAYGNAYGGAGNDVVTSIYYGSAYGGEGNDQVYNISDAYGDDGDDYVASSGSSAYGGSGNDTVIGVSDAYGGDGDDIVSAVSFVVDGGAGNDTVTGAGEGARLYGGGGNDTLVSKLTTVTTWDGSHAEVGNLDVAYVNGTVNLASTKVQAVQDGTVKLVNIYNLNGDGDFSGNNGVNWFAGGDLADRFRGMAGDDILDGAGGDDTLDGGVGADRMTGGSGNDTYFVDNVRDQVIEAAGGGTDTVKTTLTSYTLGANVETLQFQSNAASTGYGNELGNTLFGAGGNDKLYGGGGADSLNGGAGNDILYGGAGRDTFAGGAGADRFVFSSGDFDASDRAEVIKDFDSASGDKIDLSGLGITRFVGGPNGTGLAGEVGFYVLGAYTYVQGLSGDGKEAFLITLSINHALTASDFILAGSTPTL